MKNFCILPFIHLETTPNGDAKPCCLYEESMPVGNFNEQTIDEIWNGEKIKKLRNEFIEGGKPKGCHKCWSAEASGNKSKRLTDNERFNDKDIVNPYPLYLDLKLGTVCNLKCRTCSTGHSFKWKEDEIKLYGKPLNEDLQSYWVDEDSVFWNDIIKVLPYIEYFDFTGGEPLLIKRHFDILRLCVEKGDAQNISIHYNTNGTVQITDEMAELWSHFKWVEVMFSIDGMNEQFEYLRFPAKWNVVESNFKNALTYDFHVTLCHTVSKYNAWYLPKFKEWAGDIDVYYNLLHYPDYQSVKCISKTGKKLFKKRLEKDFPEIVSFMLSGDGTQDNITSRLDVIRNESAREVFKDVYDYIRIY